MLAGAHATSLDADAVLLCRLNTNGVTEVYSIYNSTAIPSYVKTITHKLTIITRLLSTTSAATDCLTQHKTIIPSKTIKMKTINRKCATSPFKTVLNFL